MKQEEPRDHRSTPQTPEHSPPPPARAEQPLTRPMALGAKFGCWGNVVGGRGRNSHRTSLGRRSHHLFAWALDDPQSTRSATRRGCTKPCPLSYLKCDSPKTIWTLPPGVVEDHVLEADCLYPPSSAES